MAYVPMGPQQQNSAQRFKQLLIEEIEKGYTRESTLKAESWEHICRQMNREYAAGQELFRVPNLKAYLQTIKKRYNYFSALLALNGVQWDMATNKVKAEESVWKAYYNAYPNAPRYRHRGEKHFDLLCHIFESGVCFD